MQIVAMTGLSYPAVRTCIDLFDAGDRRFKIRPPLYITSVVATF